MKQVSSYRIPQRKIKFLRKAVERLLCKDSKSFGVQLVDLAQVVEELIRWRKECAKERDPWADPVRVAMIDSFEDILLNAIVEE